MNPSKNLLSCLPPAVMAVSLLLNGCAAPVPAPAPAVVVVHENDNPPPLQVEVVGVAPRHGAVWIRGHWVRRPHRWMWIRGHWRY